jgi:hypothetical protein
LFTDDQLTGHGRSFTRIRALTSSHELPALGYFW